MTTVCNQVVVAMSIVTAAIPFLKPFLMSLESGFLRADDVNRRTAAGLYGSYQRTSGWTSRYIKLRNPPNVSKGSSAIVTQDDQEINVAT
jgi:hypothetical protein